MTVLSSIIQQSCTFDRGDNVQFEPIRTHDPTLMDCIRVLDPIVVCDPITTWSAISFSLGGGGVSVMSLSFLLFLLVIILLLSLFIDDNDNKGSFELGTTVGKITTPSCI